MSEIKNKRIRLALIENDMRQWELADILGYSESKVCRMLRKEMPEEEQEKIIKRIKEAR